MRAMVTASALILLSSCSSWVESTRTSVSGEASPRTTKQEAKWVNKSQYDDLMAKYKNLLAEYEQVKKTKPSNDPSSGSLAESVDVFAGSSVAAAKVEAVSPAPAPVEGSEVNRELALYRKSEAQFSAGNLSEALTAFQLLQKSPTSQIRVRAQNYVARIYVKNEQFDLALQVYEQVIQNSAFSAVVLDALQGAIECCQKLGLEEKRAQYQSILKDVFELG